MYDSMEQCLVSGKKGKGRQYGYDGRKRGNAAGHGQQEIRVRKDAGKRTIRGRRIGRTAWGLCMAAAIGGISFALAVQALAASEGLRFRGFGTGDGGNGGNGGKGIEGGMTGGGTGTENGTGNTGGGQPLETVSSNVAVPEPAKPAEAGHPLIAIDAGHGGEDEGCAAGGILEKDINLAIADLVRDKLEGMGYHVMMVREGDTYLSKEERANSANECGADLYISIHQNSSEYKEAEGIEVWYDGTDEKRDSKRLALLVGQQAVKAAQAQERETQGETDLHVLCNTRMPACLIETGFLTNEEERGRLSDGEYRERLAAGIAQGIDYYFHPKIMYLTFDDGPTQENTVRVLDILKERNIKATFFLVGENVRKHPEVAQRIAEEGHTIGIHCDNHDYGVIYESVDSYLRDFDAAYETVKEVTGVEVKLFRFPGGSANAYNGEVREGIIEEMTERGFIYFDWNASLEDAVKKSTPEQLIANGVETTLGRKTVVMLAHDVVYNTGICLEELLDRLPEYRMEALTEEVEPVQF